MLTYGEMFAGYGGLGMGVQSVLGGEMAWCAEYEAAPSAILAHHWPHVPNYGDVTKVDWSTVPRVDVITGGSPCQDLSHAGKRAGMKAGTRSGLWASMCDAIEIIRPRLVVWENVRGALSAEADSAMEPCPGCVGDGDDGPVLRALGRVLGDLAELGYDANWYGLRAADVGAPHGRFRIFVFATDATGNQGRLGNRDGELVADARRGPLARLGSAGNGLRLAAERGPVAAPDASRERHGRGEDGRVLGRVDGDDASQARERERPREVARDRSPAATPDADDTRPQRREPAGRRHVPHGRVDWGQYTPAIQRWERVLGRPAPTPTEPGPKGGQRLSPRFVEWLMGLPAGHVTGVPISRNDMLKALGNGVVPQQAAEATMRFLLGAAERVA